LVANLGGGEQLVRHLAKEVIEHFEGFVLTPALIRSCFRTQPPRFLFHPV
jgi:hypothetical protein